MTRSNLVGNVTGRSDGLVPLRIWPFIDAGLAVCFRENLQSLQSYNCTVTAEFSLGGYHMAIVVLGADGTIGSAVKKVLEEKGYEVVSVGGPRRSERGAEHLARNVIRWKCSRFVIS
jgi:hypothetical protein